MSTTPVNIIGRWRGRAKASVRNVKLQLAKKLSGSYYLGLPGDEAISEKSLIASGTFSARRVVGIQRAGLFDNYDGRRVLRRLLAQTQTTPFPVFIRDFTYFTSYFGPQYYKDLRVWEISEGLPPTRSFAEWLCREGLVRFSVIDLDLCCPFRKTIAQSVTSLFNTERLADEGYLFLTHMKGREQPKDVAWIGSLAASADRTKVRFGYVPLHYAYYAAQANYRLTPLTVIDYKDGSNGAAMLQYIFHFQRSSNARAALRDTYRLLKEQTLPHVLRAQRRSVYTSSTYQKLYLN